MLVYLNLYAHVLVYLNLYTHVLPKLNTLKYKTLYQSALELIHQYTKPKSPKTKIRTLLPVGPKGNPRGNAAAVTTPVAPAFYFLPSSRHWPEPSLSNTSGPVPEAKKTRHSVSQFHASWPPFFHAPQLCCEGYVQREFFVHGSVFL